MSAPARLSRPVAFAAVAATFVWFLAASSAPTPLYVVYQQRFTFTEFTLTLVFAVYVLALIAALLVIGPLSDHVGRRPVIIGAIALEVAALLVFLAADGVGMLLVARIVQGVATGAATTTLPATLVDLDPPHARGRAGLINGVAPLGGLGLGALGCGALVEFGPAPMQLVWAILLAGMVLAALVTFLMPETITRRPGVLASLRPRVGVPSRIRAEFAAIVPVLLASWALGGLYLSLGPSVAAGLFDLRNHLVGGLVVTILCGTGALTAFALREREPGRVLPGAAAGLALGTVVTLVGIALAGSGAGAAVLAGVGTLVAGVGFGAAAYGTFGTLARIAEPHERGELFAATYTLAYLAFSVPAVIAGVSATAVGLGITAQVYGLVVVLLALSALVVGRIVARRAERPATALVSVRSSS